ncbi:hypothetical protein B0H66DRAFT_606056 [Apodospora peruviana]|uniref:Uncharacterized protein n=1 Tax=Apodospora peruviana TaxID=516989 RepID=A0AAE0M113_9PEZI|nr:hypothetical protein B0H66DRAFT_606056 [Apodospora peruviana]
MAPPSKKSSGAKATSGKKVKVEYVSDEEDYRDEEEATDSDAPSRQSQGRASASAASKKARTSKKEWNYTHIPANSEQRKKNGRVEGRNLITWNRPRMPEKLLLHIMYECSRHRVDVPWDAIAHRLHPGSTGGAIMQHLNRMRNTLIAEGHLVPPICQKPGSRVFVDPTIRGYIRKDPDSSDDMLSTRPVPFSEPCDDRRFNLPDAYENTRSHILRDESYNFESSPLRDLSGPINVDDDGEEESPEAAGPSTGVARTNGASKGRAAKGKGKKRAAPVKVKEEVLSDPADTDSEEEYEQHAPKRMRRSSRPRKEIAYKLPDEEDDEAEEKTVEQAASEPVEIEDDADDADDADFNDDAAQEQTDDVDIKDETSQEQADDETRGLSAAAPFEISDNDDDEEAGYDHGAPNGYANGHTAGHDNSVAPYHQGNGAASPEDPNQNEYVEIDDAALASQFIDENAYDEAGHINPARLQAPRPASTERPTVAFSSVRQAAQFTAAPLAQGGNGFVGNHGYGYDGQEEDTLMYGQGFVQHMSQQPRGVPHYGQPPFSDMIMQQYGPAFIDPIAAVSGMFLGNPPPASFVGNGNQFVGNHSLGGMPTPDRVAIRNVAAAARRAMEDAGLTPLPQTPQRHFARLNDSDIGDGFDLSGSSTASLPIPYVPSCDTPCPPARRGLTVEPHGFVIEELSSPGFESI